MPKRSQLLCFILSISIAFNAFSQSNIRFERMGMQRGLSNTNVSCIIQDSLGYIWLGTDDGLNKFDGYEFTSFTYGSSEIGGLNISNNRIFDIVEGDSSNLWIGTYNGLNKYNRRLNRFFSYFPVTKGSNSDANSIYSIFQENHKKLWVGTGEGLYAFDIQNNHFIELPQSFQVLNEKVIQCIKNGPNDQLFVGTNDGIYIIDGNDVQLLDPSLYSSKQVISLLFDQYNNLWVGHFSSGISVINLVDSTSRFFNKGGANELSDNYIYDITENHDGEIWIATDNGLSTYKGEGNFENYFSTEGDIYSLSSNIITDVLTDNQNRMWVSTRLGGICLYDPFRHQFNHIKKNGFLPESLSSDKITGFTETSDGKLIVGTDGGGVNIYDEEKNTFDKITKEDGLSGNKALSVKHDSKGNLWVGTWGNGLNKIAPNGKISYYKHNEEDANSIADNNIYVIFEDSKANIWIGTWGNGLSKYVSEKDHFINYSYDPKKPQSFSGSAINQIVEDKNGDLLIVTEFQGLNRFNPESGKFRHFNAQGDNSIALNALNCVLVDSKDRIWIGTNGAGLNLYNRETDTFSLFTTKDGLLNNVVVGLLEDAQGNLWISTNRGISQFNLQDSVFQNFDMADGLQSYQFMPRSSLKLSDGRLVFGGNNGFNLFNPNEINHNDKAPNVHLTGFSLFHEPISAGHESGILKNSLTYTNKIVLDNNQNFFTIHYTGISFTSQNDVVYSYQMTNLYNDWVPLSKERSISFTALPAGEYTFKLRSSVNGVNWSENPAVLSIQILPPWWKTIWALLSFGFAVILLLLGFRYLIIMRTSYESNLKLAELQSKNLLKTNKAKLKFFTNVSHEFRTPLTLILGPIENLMEAGTDKFTKQQLTIVKSNANRLLRLINQLLDFRKVETGNLKLKVADGNFVNFVKEVKLSFDSKAEEFGIKFNIFSSSNVINLYFDRDQFEKILYNLISNSFKHTPKGGEVTIKIIEQEETVDLLVIDNGKGISKENFDKIFTRFYSGESAFESTGIGLSLVNSLVRFHKAEISFESIQNERTAFKIQIKKGRDHFSDDEIIDDFKNSEEIERYVLEGPEEDYTVETTNKDLIDREKLLIVEDNNEVRQFIKSIFLKDYVILEARNGEEALELAIEEVPNLVISDVMMPIMDGIALCKKLKSNIKTSHIPVILLTARTSLIFETEGYESGADDYISKPFSSTLLKVRVNNLIESRKKLIALLHDSNDLRIEPSMVSYTSSDEKFIKAALTSIEDNISNSEYTVEDLGRDVGLSRMQLYRKLKAMLGLSANEFIRNIRLKRGAQLLKTNEYTIAEVTYMCGFSDLQYFRKCFKKQFKVNPSDYSSVEEEELDQDEEH